MYNDSLRAMSWYASDIYDLDRYDVMTMEFERGELEACVETLASYNKLRAALEYEPLTLPELQAMIEKAQRP